ncbi:hypothetical protein pipiens_000577, partial [Culex pipiens pipiens]
MMGKPRILEVINLWFSTQVFPKSLTYLSLYSNEIKLLNYGDLYFPSLETLNLERNDLPSIDASAMMLAMPKLKVVRIGGNPIDPNEFRLAVQQFRKHNVSVNDEADEAACLYKEQVVEGVCVKLAPQRKCSSISSYAKTRGSTIRRALPVLGLGIPVQPVS